MNPKDHPNAYVGLSTGTVSAFIVYELTKHGVPLDSYEASVAASVVIAGFLFAGRKLGGKRASK